MSLLSRLSRATAALFAPDTRGLPPPSLLGVSGFGMPPDFKPRETIEAYGNNIWLKAAVDSIASEVSNTPLFLQRERANGETEIVKAHQALETLRYPQPLKSGKTTLTGMQLKYLLCQHLFLAGEHFWSFTERLTASGAPRRIDVLHPENVNEKLTRDGEIASYEYRVNGTTISFDPEDVVHFKLMHPGNFYRGHSPVKSIRYAVDTNTEADKLNFYRMMNNAVPAGILKSDKAVTAEERERLLAQWRQMYSGSKNSGKTAFMPMGVGYERVQESNQDMQYAESKDRYRDEILGNFRIGLEILGRTESQTRANADAAIYVFQKFVIQPTLDMIIDTLNNDYLFAFPGTEGLTFAYRDKVPENLEDKRLNMQTLYAMGALTPNEARKEFDLEPLEQEEADLPYIDLNRVPLGSDPVEPNV